MFRFWCLLEVCFVSLGATVWAADECPEGKEAAKGVDGNTLKDSDGQTVCLPPWTKLNTDASKKPDDSVWTKGAEPVKTYGSEDHFGATADVAGSGSGDSGSGSGGASGSGAGGSGAVAPVQTYNSQDYFGAGADVSGMGSTGGVRGSGVRQLGGDPAADAINQMTAGSTSAGQGIAAGVATNPELQAGYGGNGQFGVYEKHQAELAIDNMVAGTNAQGEAYAHAVAENPQLQAGFGATLDQKIDAMTFNTTAAGLQQSALTADVPELQAGYGASVDQKIDAMTFDSTSGGLMQAANVADNPELQPAHYSPVAGADLSFGSPAQEASGLARGGSADFTPEQLKAAEAQINHDTQLSRSTNDIAVAQNYRELMQRDGPLSPEEQIDRVAMARQAGNGQAMLDNMYGNDGRLSMDTLKAQKGDDQFFEGYFGMSRETFNQLSSSDNPADQAKLQSMLEARNAEVEAQANQVMDSYTREQNLREQIAYKEGNTRFDPDYLNSQRNAQSGLPVEMQPNGKAENINSQFGYRMHPIDGYVKFHKGIDYRTRNSDEISSIANGTVTKAGDGACGSGYGTCVVINHGKDSQGNTIESLYGHLDSANVKVGQTVTEGDVIGVPGDTGHAKGEHLHMEVRINGNPVNPEVFMNTQTGQLRQQYVAAGMGSANYQAEAMREAYGPEAAIRVAGNDGSSGVTGNTAFSGAGQGTQGGTNWGQVAMGDAGASSDGTGSTTGGATKVSTNWGDGTSAPSSDPNPSAVTTGLSTRTQQDMARLANTTPGVNYDALNKRLGWPAGAAERIAMIESNGDPNSNWNKSTQYKGLFQISASEMRSVGLNDPLDVNQNVEAFARLQERNIASLQNSLDRVPSVGEAYLSHQQGRAGSVALLNGGDTPAVETLSRFYGSSKAYQVVYGNLPSSMRSQAGSISSADFAGLWAYNKVDQYLSGATTTQVAQAQNYATGGLTSGRDPYGVSLTSYNNADLASGSAVPAGYSNPYSLASAYGTSPYTSNPYAYLPYGDMLASNPMGNLGGMGGGSVGGVPGGVNGNGAYTLPVNSVDASNGANMPSQVGQPVNTPVKGIELVQLGLDTPAKLDAFCKNPNAESYKKNINLSKQICHAG